MANLIVSQLDALRLARFNSEMKYCETCIELSQIRIRELTKNIQRLEKEGKDLLKQLGIDNFPIGNILCEDNDQYPAGTVLDRNGRPFAALPSNTEHNGL
jgi:hypothetical protein